MEVFCEGWSANRESVPGVVRSDPIEDGRVAYWNTAVNTSEEVEVSRYIFRTSN